MIFPNKKTRNNKQLCQIRQRDSLAAWILLLAAASSIIGNALEDNSAALDQETTTITTQVCENAESCVASPVITNSETADALVSEQQNGVVEVDGNNGSTSLHQESSFSAETQQLTTDDEHTDEELDTDHEQDEDDEDEEDYYDEEEGGFGSELPGTDFGVGQRINSDDPAELTKLQETEAYIIEFVDKYDKFIRLRGECWNQEDLCTFWAASGECENNPEYMKQECAPACGLCIAPTGLGVQFGVPQVLTVPNPAKVPFPSEEEVMAKLAETERYMHDVIWVDDFYKSVHRVCFNKDAMCTIWAARGDCDDDTEGAFMVDTCSPACRTCKELHYDTRCAADPNDPNIWGPGDLSRMFERIVVANNTSGFHHNNNNSSTINNATADNDNHTAMMIEVTVLSRPDYLPGDDENNASYKIGPWIIAVDNFLTPQEADRLIHHGTQIGYAQSTGVGDIDETTGEYEFEVTEDRTSTNAWCEDACPIDPIIANVLDRMEAMTGIPRHHSESLQLLKYEVGQFYLTHHDYIDQERNAIQGPRILTVFMYLNDVEEGGETRFDWFGEDVKVQPKLGRVVLWPSVLDEDPLEIDNRTEHEAMPVLKGRKYGANAWFHLRSSNKAAEMGC